MPDEADQRDEASGDAMKFHPGKRDGEHAPRVFCSACDYPLAFLTEHRCPECGQTFDPSDPESYFEIDDWVAVGLFGDGGETVRAQKALSAASIDSMLEFMPESQNLGFYRERNHATQLLVHAGDAAAARAVLDDLRKSAAPHGTEKPTDRRGCLAMAVLMAGIFLMVVSAIAFGVL